MLTIRAMSDGKAYSSKHLENNDYYAEGERVVGEWQGRGAALLGLSGTVSKPDFESVRQGLQPGTDKFLRVRRSADRIAVDGTKLTQGRNLYDFTISAPKSVSVLAIIGGNERLIEAHRAAVAETLKELEEHAASRVRKGDANENRATGNLALAVYQHDTSRELDPQLHTHAVAANLTFDGKEGRWKALQASEIYERRAYLSEVYRNALARQVRALGYDIENRRDAKGRDLGFEIQGVPSDLLAKFSQRSRQRDQAIAEFVDLHGRRPSDNEVAVLVRESRADKLTEISTTELRRRQRAQLAPAEQQTLKQIRSHRQTTVNIEPSAPSLDFAADHIFDRISVAPDHQLLTEALRHGRGRIALDHLKGELAVQERSGQVLRSGPEIATAKTLEREKQMIASVNRGVGVFEPLSRGHTFVASDRLRPEQKQAVEFVLQSRDLAVNIRGAAGTGKTAALTELHRGLLESGREVLAAAPTMSAVEELQKVGLSNAITVERLLQDPAINSGLRGKVVILDEAGMVSARQMAEILRLAETASFRIVFSGDTKQILSVEAGDALRILEKESRLKTVELTQVQRQKRSAYRDAIEELRRNPARGLAKLEAMGAVREVPSSDRAATIAQAYAPSSLVVCATHDEIDRVTEAIRERRRTTGELAQEFTLNRYVSLGWTAAQKAETRHYAPGMLLTFHKATKAIGKHETVPVLRASKAGLVVRAKDGTECTITKKQANSFDVQEQRQIQIASGERMLLTANRREAGQRLTNGELVTVRGVNETGGIELEDGRILPSNYRNFAHGYAVTAHRSQGKTVDSVIISADGMKKELFYVAASRGRQDVTVITSDKDRLLGSVAQSMARKSASELMRDKDTGLLQGARRGLAMAREMVKRAAQLVQQIVNRPAKERNREYGLSR